MGNNQVAHMQEPVANSKAEDDTVPMLANGNAADRSSSAADVKHQHNNSGENQPDLEAQQHKTSARRPVEECKQNNFIAADSDSAGDDDSPSINLPSMSPVQLLFYACECGDLDLIRKAVDNGAKVNTPIQEGEKEKTEENKVKEENDDKKKKKEKEKEREKKDNKSDSDDSKDVYKDMILTGDYPIHKAVSANQLKAVELLFYLEADLERQNRIGSTALHRAVSTQKPEIVAFLIEKGAKLNATNHIGNTPLHIASYLGNVEIATQLLHGRTDAWQMVACVNRGGMTPIDYARKKSMHTLLTGHRIASSNPSMSLQTHAGQGGTGPHTAPTPQRRPSIERTTTSSHHSHHGHVEFPATPAAPGEETDKTAISRYHSSHTGDGKEGQAPGLITHSSHSSHSSGTHPHTCHHQHSHAPLSPSRHLQEKLSSALLSTVEQTYSSSMTTGLPAEMVVTEETHALNTVTEQPLDIEKETETETDSAPHTGSHTAVATRTSTETPASLLIDSHPIDGDPTAAVSISSSYILPTTQTAPSSSRSLVEINKPSFDKPPSVESHPITEAETRGGTGNTATLSTSQLIAPVPTTTASVSPYEVGRNNPAISATELSFAMLPNTSTE